MNIEQNLRASGLHGEATLWEFARGDERATVAFIDDAKAREEGVDQRLSYVHAHFIEANRSLMHVGKQSVTATLRAVGYELTSQELKVVRLA